MPHRLTCTATTRHRWQAHQPLVGVEPISTPTSPSAASSPSPSAAATTAAPPTTARSATAGPSTTTADLHLSRRLRHPPKRMRLETAVHRLRRKLCHPDRRDRHPRPERGRQPYLYRQERRHGQVRLPGPPEHPDRHKRKLPGIYYELTSARPSGASCRPTSTKPPRSSSPTTTT